MKQEKDYIQDIAEIRSMMERSSKFLSLSGWAGIMAGIYALVGAFIAYRLLNFNPVEVIYSPPENSWNMTSIILLAIAVLVLALATAVFLSYKRAGKRGEKLWNPTSKQLLFSMMVPLITGAVVILLLVSERLLGLIAPFSLLFYGLALFNASRYTYKEVQALGLVEIFLGLISCYFVEYGLLFWAIGFGLVHIIYGIHMNYKYGR